jgi:hypothetical protein
VHFHLADVVLFFLYLPNNNKRTSANTTGMAIMAIVGSFTMDLVYIPRMMRTTRSAIICAILSRGELMNIRMSSFPSGLRNGDVPASDKTYLAQLVSARTGISRADAEKRVDDVIAKAKDAENKARQAADTARKTAAAVAFFTAFSMLNGAFIAAVAATIAGHRRDEKLALRG